MAEQSFIASIPLQTNVSTANPNEAVKPIDAIATFRTANITESIAPPEILDHVTNTGQINEAGVTNNYLMDASSTYTYTYVTEGGDVIGLNKDVYNHTSVYLNGVYLDKTSGHSISSIQMYDTYDDIIFTDTDPVGLRVSRNASSFVVISIYNVTTGAQLSSFTLSSATFTAAYPKPNFCLVQQSTDRASPSFYPSSPQYVAFSGWTTLDRTLIGILDSSGNTLCSVISPVVAGITNPISIWSCKVKPGTTNPVFFFLQPGVVSSNNPLTIFSLTGTAYPYTLASSNSYDVSYGVVFKNQVSSGSKIFFTGDNVSAVTNHCYVTSDGSDVFPSVTLPSNTQAPQPSTCGWGYIDINVGSVSPSKIITANVSGVNSDVTVSTASGPNPFNGFGQMFNCSGQDDPCFRIGMVADSTNKETMQFISVSHGAPGDVARISSSSSTGYAGVPLSPYGEIDILWGPRCLSYYNGSSSIAWKYGKKIFIATTTNGVPSSIPLVQKIDSSTYKINTISPLSIVDTSKRSMVVGSIDYSGSGFSQYASSSGTTLRDSVILTSTTPSPISSGIDPGGYLDYGTSFVHFSPAYSAIPLTNNTYYYIGTYIGSPMTLIEYRPSSYPQEYSSYPSNVQNSIIPSGSAYISNSQQLPMPIGVLWSGQQITGSSIAVYPGYEETFISSGFSGSVISSSWDGYLIGNGLPIQYQSFVIYGQAYLYDGKTIYSVTMSSNYVTTPLPVVCRAEGMTYLAASPTVAYFLSTFDNSIWYFDGARTLSKLRKFNQYPAIKSGVFNVRDNCLTLDADPYWIFVRDGFISITQKTSAQIGQTVRMFDTQNGTYLNIGTHFYQYGYSPSGVIIPTGLTGSTAVQPVDFQTAYYGLGNNRITRNMRFYVTVYSSAKVKTSITVTVYSFNQDESKGKTSANPEIKVVNINPVDYDDGGYFRFSADPIHAKVLASSLRIQCNSKIAITEVMLKYDDSGMDAIYAPERRAR